MAWFSINPQFSYIPLILYLGAIFWTLAYDTIYGFQDIRDDEITELKSTSIEFKKILNNLYSYVIQFLLFINQWSINEI